MAPDDRERNFDKALARHLRPHAPGGADASHPDAELLAAYHERLLAPEQMISSKEHIAGCSRCQQILAQLEAKSRIYARAYKDGAVELELDAPESVARKIAKWRWSRIPNT